MPAGYGLSQPQPQPQYKPPRYTFSQSSQLHFRSCKPGVDRQDSQNPAAVATGCSMGLSAEIHRQSIVDSADAQESAEQKTPSKKRKR